MIKRSYLSIDTFCSKYGGNYQSITSQKSMGYYPESIFKYNGKRELYIDENYFTRRKEFRRRIQLYNQEMYYFLIDSFTSEAHIGRVVNEMYGVNAETMSVFLNAKLFSTLDSMFKNKVSETEWAFNKFCRVLIRDINRRKPYDFNFESVVKILDRRML